MSWKTLKHPGSRRIKKAFFVLRSSFFQDQAPTALEESVLRSSFFQDQAPTALWINNHPPIQDQAPTALEESVLRSLFFQDQAPTALWINNHPPIQDQAPTALEESVLRSSFIVLPRSSPDGPLDQPFTNSRSSTDGP
ncbi:hypothetical protein TB2_003083 [Malus domestica]